VGEGDRLLVAVSGGCDSTALLRALATLAPRRRWQLNLTVAHVHHHLRESADDDAAFVEALADHLDLPYARADVHPQAQSDSNIESAARYLRYDALGDLAAQHRAAFVVTAHQADDQLETFLMRLMRGAGARGLRGIAWRRRLTAHTNQHIPHQAPLLIRPMLAATRDEARTFLETINQPWREDPTNQDTKRRRAQLRHDVLPALRRMQPDVAHKAVTTAGHFRQLHELVRQTARQWRPQAVGASSAGHAITLDRAAARQMPRVVLTELLRQLLHEAGAPRDRLTRRTLAPLLRALRDTVGGQRAFDLPGPITATLDRDTLALQPHT
jgi:tRNA(Ile)-lysidine synthase